MSYWIHSMPSWFLALLTVFLFQVVALGGLFISRRTLTRHLVFSQDFNDAVNYFGSAIATLYSVTLGLIAVASWQNYSDIKNLVSKEAASIGVFYRDLAGYPEPLRTDLRHRVRAYTMCVIEKAWPAQRHGELIDEPTNMLTDIHELFLQYEPPNLGRSVMHAEALRKFNEILDLRRQRVDQVDEGLPMVLWVVLGVGAILTMAVTYFFYIEDVRFHVLLLSVLATFVALMVYLIAALDRPFRGEISVPPDSYELIVKKLMDPVDAAAAAKAKVP